MPRAGYTTAQFNAIRQRRKAITVKAEVETAVGGVFTNMSNLVGRDWFKSARLRDNADAPNWEGEITFVRESKIAGVKYSLAPEMEASPLNIVAGSYSPAIDGMRRIRLSTTIMTPGVSPTGLVEVFDGYISEPEYGGRDAGLIRCSVRDKYGLLMQQMTSFGYMYGSNTPGAVTIEAALQAILDDHPNTKLPGGVTLWLPFGPPSPAVGLTLRTLPVGPLLLALRNIADQIGWTVKPRYDSTGALRLAFYPPDRAKTVPDYSFTLDDFYDISSYSVPTDDVRNGVEIGFIDRATGLPSSYFTGYDAVSALRYGERYMRIQEEATSNIDSMTEATLMGDAAQSDLKAPYAAQRVHMGYCWITEVGDLIGFPINNVIYDQPKNLAVIEIEHTFENGVAETNMLTRAQVVGAYKNWLEKAGNDDPTAKAPTVSLVSVLQTAALSADVTIEIGTYNETAGVTISNTPGGTTLWTLVVSGSDSTPRNVTDGTQLGPADWFYDAATSTFAQILSAVPLDPVSTTFIYAQADGKSSLLFSPWLAIALPGATTTGGQGGGPAGLGTSVNVIIPVLLTDPADAPSVFAAAGDVGMGKFSYNPAPFVQIRLDADIDVGGGAGVYAQLQVFTGAWSNVPGATVDLSTAGLIRGTPIGNPINSEQWFRVVLVGL